MPVRGLIVDMEYQKRGIGTYLFKTIMQRYSEARMFVVVIDMEDMAINKFYQSFNFKRRIKI